MVACTRRSTCRVDERRLQCAQTVRQALALAYFLRQRIAAGGEARRHVSYRLCRARGTGPLAEFEGFSRQRRTPFGDFSNDQLGQPHVAQKREAIGFRLGHAIRRALATGSVGTLGEDGHRLADTVERFFVPPLFTVHRRQVVQTNRDIAVFATEGVSPDFQRAFVQTFRFVVLVSIVQQRGKVVEDRRKIRVFGAESPRHDGNCAVIERLRRIVLATAIVQQCQVVEAFSHVGMVGAEDAFADGQRPLKQRLCGVLAIGRLIECGQVVETVGYPGVTRPKRGFHDRQGPLVQGLRLGIAGLVFIKSGQVM